VDGSSKPRYRLEVEAPANGRVGKGTVTVLDAGGKVKLTDRADLQSAREREKLVGRLAAKLDADPKALGADLDTAWHETLDRHRQAQAQASAAPAPAGPEVAAELLDEAPATISRPLCLVGEHAYAAACVQVRVVTRRSVDSKTGKVTEHDPPLETVAERLVVVRHDGVAFCETPDGIPRTRPLEKLGLPVRLPLAVAPSRGWSGAGLKRYLARERPDPVKVFAGVQSVVDHYVDFIRSLGTQAAMLDFVSCYILATYFLDAFNVIGYLWPNGAAGSGKTTLLEVVAETAYLGELILAGSSYATLRDLADYGACLCFDDAEAMMDRTTDPDKKTLLLAGNRRGNAVALKEPTGEKTWRTRHVHTFCPRAFSAIRLPHPVLGTRTVIVPMQKSGDPAKTKRSVQDYTSWPCDRRRLIDDLWALGLAHLPALRGHDELAARAARLQGRELEPWRAVLAVAHWLAEDHGVTGLFRAMEELSVSYQNSRRDFEAPGRERLLVRGLLRLVGHAGAGPVRFTAGELAGKMKEAVAEGCSAAGWGREPGLGRVGKMLRAMRFRKAKRTSGSRERGWLTSLAEVQDLVRAFRADQPDSEEDGAAGDDGGDVCWF
jgi:hypothetical protein